MLETLQVLAEGLSFLTKELIPVSEIELPKEDYFFHAVLSRDNFEVREIPCKIYLPEKPTGKPRIILQIKKDQVPQFSYLMEVSLKGQIRHLNNSISTEIFSSKVTLLGPCSRHWGSDLWESTVEGEPQDLHIKIYWGPHPEIKEKNINFWISENKILSPDIIRTTSYTGEITTERVRQLEFSILDGVLLKFDRHFKSVSDNDKEVRQWSYLVAESKIKFPGDDTETVKREIIPALDDFLLLASLGSRTRTACIGWEANDGEHISKFFRRDISVPTGFALGSFDHGLIPLAEFQEYLQTVYRSFNQLKNKRPVRMAIYSIVPGKPRNLEDDYRSLFSGLEELLLEYRKERGLEVVLNQEDWLKLQKNLKSVIKSISEIPLTKNQRSYIYQKLPELNRMPLRAVFDQYCKEIRTPLEDLWPMFADEKDMPGLYDIRNFLLHGRSLPSEMFDALWMATENLRWTLERILLSFLNWPVSRSEVSQKFLGRGATALKDFPREREMLGKFINL